MNRFLRSLLRFLLGASPAELQRRALEDAGKEFIKGFSRGIHAIEGTARDAPPKLIAPNKKNRPE